eukprot:TRINITY_DN12097_c0_g1_i4.p3 TRINITY_DN12097_c0_g1~~TRINITY_DN12097_c0_g1_i4.p3  ORF type:complete len:100 (-),score=14.29 TRINITY_DN12097_c0_g1_i4:62-361(-)
MPSHPKSGHCSAQRKNRNQFVRQNIDPTDCCCESDQGDENPNRIVKNRLEGRFFCVFEEEEVERERNDQSEQNQCRVCPPWEGLANGVPESQKGKGENK